VERPSSASIIRTPSPRSKVSIDAYFRSPRAITKISL
jgi:hypothetical protein